MTQPFEEPEDTGEAVRASLLPIPTHTTPALRTQHRKPAFGACEILFNILK